MGMGEAEDGSGERPLPPNWHSENKLFPPPHPLATSDGAALSSQSSIPVCVNRPHPNLKQGLKFLGRAQGKGVDMNSSGSTSEAGDKASSHDSGIWLKVEVQPLTLIHEVTDDVIHVTFQVLHVHIKI